VQPIIDQGLELCR